MNNLTIRGVDEKLERALKEKAQQEHMSMNKLVIRILQNNLVKDKQSEILKTYDDLDHLAGTWSEAEAREFEEYITPFEQIDEEMWK
ncbi:MAG: antitoxin [Spirochaetia bacterium]